jgi:hypothetical protein
MLSKFYHTFLIYIRNISVYKTLIYTPANTLYCPWILLAVKAYAGKSSSYVLLIYNTVLLSSLYLKLFVLGKTGTTSGGNPGALIFDPKKIV